MAGGSGRRRAPGTNGQSAGADVGAGDQPETCAPRYPAPGARAGAHRPRPACGSDNVGGYGAYVDRDALKREVDAELLTEKEQEIQDLRETVEVRLQALTGIGRRPPCTDSPPSPPQLLDRKVQKLEQLVRLKDSKIQALQSRLAGGDGQ